MTKPKSRADLIAALAEDLAPVRRVRPWEGAALIAIATLVAAIAASAMFTFWSGILTGEASPFFWIANGLLLLLGGGQHGRAGGGRIAASRCAAQMRRHGPLRCWACCPWPR